MNSWKMELQRTSDCIPIERLSEDLTPREHSHLAHCARCQAELALWKEMNAAETAGESAAVERIASDVRQRLESPAKVVSITSHRRFLQPASLAAAAVLIVAIAVGVLMQNREPSIEAPTRAITAYRSASVQVVAPVGDVPVPPAALQWKAAAGASSYDVQIMEVDHTTLWRASTHDLRISLPSNVVDQLVPGKTVLWQVQARRDQAIVADSGIQRFRVRAAQ